MIQEFSHFKGVNMDVTDNKANLPTHMFARTSEYSRIKTKHVLRIEDHGKKKDLTSCC